MSSLLLSFIIPLLTIDIKRPAPVDIHESTENSGIPLSDQPFTENDDAHKEEIASLLSIGWSDGILYAYLLFSCLLFSKLVIGIFRIVRVKGEYVRDGRIKVVLVNPNSPFRNSSFLTSVFIDKTLPEDVRQLIIQHEKEHIRSWHFADKIFANFHVALFWFNPFAYAYFHAIEANHEYEIDDKMVKGIDKQTYTELLLDLTQTSANSFITFFSRMPLKKRINMLYNKPTSPMKKLIYLSILPLLAVCFFAFTNKREIVVASETMVTSIPVSPSSVNNPTIIKSSVILNDQKAAPTKPVSNKTPTSNVVAVTPDVPASIQIEQISPVPSKLNQHLPSQTVKSEVGEIARPFVLVIDAGHGGTDDASKGINGIKEKDMNLTAALLLKEEAEKRGIDVIMTRNSDKFVPLSERVAAQKAGGAFISIHHNSKKSKGKKQNAQVFNGLEVIIADQEASGVSRVLAEDVLRSLKNIEGVSVKDSLTRTSIYVLREAVTPSILVEMGNISNPENFDFISDHENVRKVCNLILDGYTKFMN